MTEIGMKRHAKAAYGEVKDLGGLRAFWSGEWLLKLIQRSLREPPRLELYGQVDNPEQAVRRLSRAAARKAGIAGIAVGSAVSLDELIALLTAGEAGMGIPANIAVAGLAVCAELFYVTRLQLKLVQSIARLHGKALDADNPEDLLTAFSITLGALANDPNVGMGSKVGIAEVQHHLSHEMRGRLKQVARKAGIRIFRRSVLKAAFPVVSIATSASANYRNTTAIAAAAAHHFRGSAVTLVVS
ncbi:MAG: hypothetical protein ABI383_06300 [Acidobacteriaceae bacterium]